MYGIVDPRSKRETAQMTAALRPFRVIAKRVKAFRGRRGGSTKSATSAEAGPKLVDLPAKNRWLLISNCQAIGLARAMQMVNPDFRITPMGHWAAVRDPQRTCQEALTGGYSRVFVSPDIEQAGIDLSGAPNLTRIPRVVFTAFHPDCIYALSRGKPVKGPLDAYHSMIVMAAHKAGMGVDDARRLFTGAMFEKMGYMDQWAPQRDRLVADYAAYGLDISAGVRRWGRTSAFMHTIDHPKMICLQDIARVILRSVGEEDRGGPDLAPPDNLANGVGFAVYPEIGEALGVPGGYRFKRFDDYRHIGLEQMIAESYHVYDQHPDIQPDPGSLAAFRRVLEAVA